MRTARTSLHRTEYQDPTQYEALDSAFDAWSNADATAAHRDYEDEQRNARADQLWREYEQLKANIDKQRKRLVAIGNREGVTAVDPSRQSEFEELADYDATMDDASYRRGF